jgi:hypothetical protein
MAEGFEVLGEELGGAQVERDVADLAAFAVVEVSDAKALST